MAQLANSFNGCSVFEILRLHVLKFKYLGLEGIEKTSYAIVTFSIMVMPKRDPNKCCCKDALAAIFSLLKDISLFGFNIHHVLLRRSQCRYLRVELTNNEYMFSMKRQKVSFSPTEFKTILLHPFLLNFVALNVGNSCKTYETQLFEHLLHLNRIVGAKVTVTATVVCCLFLSGKDKITARNCINHCVDYRPLMNTNKVSNES